MPATARLLRPPPVFAAGAPQQLAYRPPGAPEQWGDLIGLQSQPIEELRPGADLLGAVGRPAHRQAHRDNGETLRDDVQRCTEPRQIDGWGCRDRSTSCWRISRLDSRPSPAADPSRSGVARVFATSASPFLVSTDAASLRPRSSAGLPPSYDLGTT